MLSKKCTLLVNRTIKIAKMYFHVLWLLFFSLKAKGSHCRGAENPHVAP